jgi:hypothetical protein
VRVRSSASHCCLACRMSSSSAVGVHDPLLDHDEVVGLPQRPRWFSRTRPIIDNARQFLASNLGLLLVVISDAFFSFINVCVKQLSVDDQISTFEVSARENFRLLHFVFNLGYFGN